jgi:transposase
MAMTIVESTRSITGGVDTHADVHVAAVVDGNGGVLGVEPFEATSLGYDRLYRWLASFGPVGRVGVEGTGASGVFVAMSFGKGRSLKNHADNKPW